MEQALYAEHAAVEDTHWWWQARREIFATVIREYAPTTGTSGLRLVEVGCGSGGNLPMLAKFGAVLGAEPEPTAVAYLRKKRGDAFDVVRHRVPDPLPGRFHVIGMFDVLEHIEDDQGALNWAGEQLEPGGILVLSVPAFQFLWTEQDEAVHHFRRYTPEQLVRLVPSSLSIEHVTCFNSLLFPAILAVRAAMRLNPLRHGPPRSHLGIPPAPLNWLFRRILGFERHWVARTRVSFGVSILLVARRPFESRQT